MRLFLLLALGPLIAQTPLLKGLGEFHYEIETDSKKAQDYFDQGLLFFYGFDYAQSILSYKAAIEADPKAQMPYFGLAYSLGSVWNTVITGNERAEAIDAIERGKKEKGTNKSRALLDALSKRYSEGPKQNNEQIVSPKEASAFIDAMRQVAKDYPEDATVQTLFAAALFFGSDWTFWTQTNAPTTYTDELLQTLRSTLVQDPTNPGACHYYIHAVETSPRFRNALPCAEEMVKNYPGMEHLVHMVSHLYIRTGAYTQSINANLQAISAFNRYYDQYKRASLSPPINFLDMHNYQFLWTSAMLQGREALAQNAADYLGKVAKNKLKSNEELLQKFLVMPYLHQLKFGKWEMLINNPEPSQPYQRDIWNFSKGMAYAHLREMKKAQMAYAAIAKTNELPRAILDARLLNDPQKWEKAFEILPKEEPPIWYFFIIEGLAKSYLDNGNRQKALETYLTYLEKFPENGWALFGALLATGKEEFKKRYYTTWRYADVILPLQ